MQPTYILAARSACHMACQLARRATRRAAIRLAVGSALLALPGLPLTPGTLASQNVSDLLTAGDRDSAARRTRAALDNFERAVQAEPTSYPALWKAAREAVDLGEFESNVETRTALYRRATDYARRAVLANTNEAEGHFQLSRAVGRTALAANPRDRVSYSREVREEALKALQLFPKHPGALHVLGIWNAEVMRLNSFSRALAKTFLGGQVLGVLPMRARPIRRPCARRSRTRTTRAIARAPTRSWRSSGRYDHRADRSALLSSPGPSEWPSMRSPPLSPRDTFFA